MITSLAKKRIRYNKSRSLLTIIAIALTTTLLMALGTSAVGLLNFNKQVLLEASLKSLKTMPISNLLKPMKYLLR